MLQRYREVEDAMALKKESPTSQQSIKGGATTVGIPRPLPPPAPVDPQSSSAPFLDVTTNPASPPLMAGSGANGKWEASSVTNRDILKLKGGGYFPANVAHRAPKEGQVIPTPEPCERVVFSPISLGALDFPYTPLCAG